MMTELTGKPGMMPSTSAHADTAASTLASAASSHTQEAFSTGPPKTWGGVYVGPASDITASSPAGIMPESAKVPINVPSVASRAVAASVGSEAAADRGGSRPGSLRSRASGGGSFGGSFAGMPKRSDAARSDVPVWGGVYVGPASDALASQSQSPTLIGGAGGVGSDEQPSSTTGSGASGGGPIKSLTGSFRRKSGRKPKVAEAASGSGALPSSSGGLEDKRSPDAGASERRLESESILSPRRMSKKFFKLTGKIKCEACNKKCTGDILKADDRYFHIHCFICKDCHKSLNDLGFFERNGDYYCPQHYHSKFGSRCGICDEFVEGEVVTVMGKSYHQQCFKCDRCKQPFPSGQKVTFTGREHLCQKCLHIPVAKIKPTQLQQNGELVAATTQQAAPPPPLGLPSSLASSMTIDGATPAVSSEAVDGHATDEDGGDVFDRPGSPSGPMSPTACASCGELIRSGQVLLALDAQWHIWCFKCTTCGAVLHGEYMAKNDQPYCIRDYNAQFGVKCDECGRFVAGKVLQAGDFHFHPSCARCVRCGDHFGDGEEMYMQGNDIWHPKCHDLIPPEKIVHTPRSARSTFPATTPGVIRASTATTDKAQELPHSASGMKYSVDFGRHLTYMYLLPEPDAGYLKQPISPHPPATPQFHMPSGTPVKIRKSRTSCMKTGMQKLTRSLEDTTPRPKSPYMNNEEPIEMAHYPGAHFPEPGEVRPIEREDFPAPLYPYAVDELRRRLSASDADDDDDDETDGEVKLEKQEEKLKVIATESSIAQVFAANVEERIKSAKVPKPVDPRSTSRTPNAKKNPIHRCRYESPINASPSRYLNRPRPWDFWKDEKDKRAATTTIPHYMVPKPGYGLAPKAATLPGSGFPGGYYDMVYDDMVESIRSADLSDRGSTLDGRWSISSARYYDRYQPAYGSGLMRTSLPDMSKPPTIYSYKDINTGNKRLPEDIDRCHLERHLAREEFEQLFGMTPLEFYKLPEWKRINNKRKLKLF